MPKENAVTRAIKRQGPVSKKRTSTVWIEGKWLWFEPSFSPSHEVREWGGRWENRQQAWRLPRLVRFARRIADYDPDATFSVEAKRLEKGEIEKQDATVFWANLEYEARRHPAWKELKDFQQQAVMALVVRALHGTGLILSPGLGKTPVSIVAGDLILKFKGKSQRICIVAPLSLTKNWMREITGTQIGNPKQIQWSDDPRWEICHGTLPSDDRSVKWTVTNYETPMERLPDPNVNRVLATGNLDPEWDLDWDLVVFDESVMLKNRKAKRTTAHRTLARAAGKTVMSSGSPITHDNSDFFAQAQMMEPEYFTSFWTFTKESCVVVRTPWSQGDIQGSRHDFHMRDEYPEMLFVRNQEEVFDELPENIFMDIELPLTKRQQKAHDDIMDTWLHVLDVNADRRIEVTAIIAMLTRLQQVTSNLYNLQTTGEEWPDESSKADFIQEDLALGDIEWPCLIWTHHRPGATILLERLRKQAKAKKDVAGALKGRRIELVMGGMKKKADEYISAYKAGDVDVLILGIGVGKYGHTLANSRTVYTYDKTWDSDAWFQMLHRYGGARAVMAGYHHRPVVKTLRCRRTVDDFIELNLAGKLPAMADMTGAQLAKILRSLGEEFTNGS